MGVRFFLPKTWGEWAAEVMGWDDAKIRDQAERFKDHHLGAGSEKADWQAAWRMWCRREPDFAPRPSRAINGHADPDSLKAAGLHTADALRMLNRLEGEG